MRVAARPLHRDDFFKGLSQAPREERPAVDHHVDLVSARGERLADIEQLHGE